MNLSQCDGRRVAMIWHLPHGCRVFRGMARYVRGAHGQDSLWIKPDGLGPEAGNPEFVLNEREWRGEIVRGQGNDCDYQVEIHADTNR